MNPVILAFNLPSAAVPNLKMLCARMKLPLKLIGQELFGATLGELAAGIAAPGEQGGFEEPMLVMAGLSDTQFNAFLQGLKRFGVPRIPLKAILTPYNAGWSAVKLHEELCAERDAIENGKAAHTPE